tara:strand:+ start:1513 stop:2781 length:1269 start_codon:yes stop_codon:yes gene_type:complete
MDGKRVVISGIGLVTPLGIGQSKNWNNLISGESGINFLNSFDASDLTCRIGGEIPSGPSSEGKLDLDEWLNIKEQRKLDRFIMLGLVAANEAIRDSNIEISNEEILKKTGVIVGSGIGGLKTISETSILLEEKGPRRISPFFIPSSLINLISGQISIKYGFKGPNHSVVTACSTGSHAIGDAYRIISNCEADIMIAGGAEAAICKLGVAGFAAARALSTSFNDNPKEASRPWDKNRDGFVMGEGAGILVLEELEHAKKRGAKIYAEIIGYGMSGDAYHITAPEPSGTGALSAMNNALKNAKLNPEKIDYINAHGTSTPLGDLIELQAVSKLLNNNVSHLLMSSTKSSIGHLLGAAGAVEAIFSILSMQNNVAPPTINLHEKADEGKDFNLVPNASIKKNINYSLSNSFGFGGTNASLVFKKI